MQIAQLLVNINFASSLSDARRKIKNKAISIDRNKIEDENAILALDTVSIDDNMCECVLIIENVEVVDGVVNCDITPVLKENFVVSFGKKKFIRINLENGV